MGDGGRGRKGDGGDEDEEGMVATGDGALGDKTCGPVTVGRELVPS